MLSTSLLVALVAAAALGEDTVRILGGNRFYSGGRFSRTLEGPDDHYEVEWWITAYGAEIARGDGAGRHLGFKLPRVQRTVAATLHLRIPGREDAELPIEIHPSRMDRLKRLLRGVETGVVGGRGRFASLLARTGRRPARLDSPGAIRRFPGRLVVLVPGDWDVAPLLPALLTRVREGLHVLALGPDDAPWSEAKSPPEPPELVTDYTRSLHADPFSVWGKGRPMFLTPLREGRGNHREPVPHLVRIGVLGKGRLVLSRLRIMAHIEHEPLAEQVMVDLIEWALAEPERFTPPSTVEGENEKLDRLFRADGGDGPVIVALPDWNPGPAAPPGVRPEVRSARGGRVLLVSAGGSLYHDMGKTTEGPGTDSPAEFARFVTRLGIRLAAKTIWREP